MTDVPLISLDSDGGSRRTLGTLVADFYRAFDNRDAKTPDSEYLYALFAQEAAILRLDGGTREILDLDRFIQPRIALLNDGRLRDFHEWEVWGETVAFGNIASHWSRYEKLGTFEGQPIRGRGRKLLHFCRESDRWRITGLTWEDDPGSWPHFTAR